MKNLQVQDAALSRPFRAQRANAAARPAQTAHLAGEPSWAKSRSRSST